MKFKICLLVALLTFVSSAATYQISQQTQKTKTIEVDPFHNGQNAYVGSMLNVDQFNDLWTRENSNAEERCMDKVMPLVGFVARITDKTIGNNIIIELRGVTSPNIPTFYIDTKQDISGIRVGDVISIEGVCHSKLIFRNARVLGKLPQ